MTEWVSVTSLEKVKRQKNRDLVNVDGVDIVIFWVDNAVYAMEDSCPHAGSALCMGDLDGLAIRCRAHGLKFDLRTGCMPGVPKGMKARVFPARLVGDKVEIQVEAQTEPAQA